MKYWFIKLWGNITNFFYRVSALVKWGPVIWSDRDWDYGFIYDLLDFKLRRILDSSKDWNMDEARLTEIRRDIRTCVKLISLVKDETYAMEHYDYVEFVHDFIPVPGRTDVTQLQITYNNDRLDNYFKKYHRLYKLYATGQENTTDTRVSLAAKIGQHRQAQAKALLFRIIHDKIEYWWD